MTSIENRDLNGNIIKQDYEKYSLINEYNDERYNQSKYLLQPIDPAPLTSSRATLTKRLSAETSTRKQSAAERLLSDNDSLFDSEDEEKERNRLARRIEERKRNLSNLDLALCDIEKADTADMMDTIESTFRRLSERTSVISESLETVTKKHQRVHLEMKDNIDIIKEMRLKVQELINKQDQIGKNYKQVDQYIASTKPVGYSAFSSYTTPAFKPSRQSYDEFSDDENYAPEPKTKTSERRYSSEEEEPPSQSKYSYEDEPQKYIDEDESKRQRKYSDDEEDPENQRKYSDNEEEPKNQRKYSDEEDEPRNQQKYSDDEENEHVVRERYSDEEDDRDKRDRNDEHDEKNDAEDNDNDTEGREVEEEFLREEEARLAEEQRRQEEEFVEDERRREEEEKEILEREMQEDEDFDEETARLMAEAEIAKLKIEEGIELDVDPMQAEEE